MPSSTIGEEYAAAYQSAALLKDPGLRVLRVTGSDRGSWLHKLITAEVQNKRPGTGARAALLDAKGHFAGEFSFLVRSEEILLVTGAPLHTTLLDLLRHYIFREKVRVEDASGEYRIIEWLGPDSSSALRQMGIEPAPQDWSGREGLLDKTPVLAIRTARYSVPAFELLVPASDLSGLDLGGGPQIEISPETRQVLRVEAGTTSWGEDIGPGVLVLEAPFGFEIRIDQGCYVGQEVVARIVHRGHVNRQLVGLVLAMRSNETVPPRPGDQLSAEGKPAGTLTSTVQSPRLGQIGLALVKREFAEAGRELAIAGSQDNRASVVQLPFKREAAADQEREIALPQ